MENKIITRKAKQLLQEYNECLKPFLKREMLYQPMAVKAVAIFMNNATYYNVHLAQMKNLNDEDELLKVQLRLAIDEVIDLLENQEEEFCEEKRDHGNVWEVEFIDE